MMSYHVEIVDEKGRSISGTIPRDERSLATIRAHLEYLNPGALSITILSGRDLQAEGVEL